MPGSPQKRARREVLAARDARREAKAAAEALSVPSVGGKLASEGAKIRRDASMELVRMSQAALRKVLEATVEGEPSFRDQITAAAVVLRAYVPQEVNVNPGDGSVDRIAALMDRLGVEPPSFFDGSINPALAPPRPALSERGEK